MSTRTANHLSLGYPFVPVPLWISDSYEAGEMSRERKEIQEALYKRANWSRLAARKATPQLRLDSLARATFRGDDSPSLDALRRLLGKMREGGEVGYEAKGVGRRTVYHFTLYPEQRRSGAIPGLGQPCVPASHTAETSTTNRHGAERRDYRDSGLKNTVRVDDGPSSSTSGPGSARPCIPLSEQDCATKPGSRVPVSSDIREKPEAALTKRVDPPARAQEIEELLDQFWVETLPPSRRGCAWEPNG